MFLTCSPKDLSLTVAPGHPRVCSSPAFLGDRKHYEISGRKERRKGNHVGYVIYVTSSTSVRRQRRTKGSQRRRCSHGPPRPSSLCFPWRLYKSHATSAIPCFAILPLFASLWPTRLSNSSLYSTPFTHFVVSIASCPRRTPMVLKTAMV